jgi:cryptochrome
MTVAIVWFRKSLRIHDNHALSWACESEEITSIIPIYIFEEQIDLYSTKKMSANRLRFQYECVTNLSHNLREKLGLDLHVFSGDYLSVLKSISGQLHGQNVCLTDEYCSEPATIEQRIHIHEDLVSKEHNWSTKIFPAGHTILDIEAVVNSPSYRQPNSMKDMVRIFTEEFGDFQNIFFDTKDPIKSNRPHHQKLMINTPYSINLVEIEESTIGSSYFVGGETEALARLENKVISEKEYVNNFSKPRTQSTNLDGRPMEPSTTGLSPYISTGCLSVRTLWNSCSEIQQHCEHTKPPTSIHGQLMFREMFYLLSKSVANWDKNYSNTHCKQIDWGEANPETLSAWESGLTGFPLIDAMMRQLDSTGWMHHLGRHATSCFLTRGQLWQNWTHGRDIFERKLIDSDWAINNGNWLWLAGVAPFSMPYYRIYNPCPDSKSSLNVETENADFIRHWVPELSKFPSKFIFEPHLAPLSVQESADCIIGEDYPKPIVDRKESRKQNLERFKQSLAKRA